MYRDTACSGLQSRSPGLAIDAFVGSVWLRLTVDASELEEHAQLGGRLQPFGRHALDDATRLQHNCIMKTAIIPQVRVEPQLRADLEDVLREGETLSDFLEATVRQAVEYRRMQAEFDARADAAWARFQQTGAAVPAGEVVAEMRARLEARRRELQGKHRPTAA